MKDLKDSASLTGRPSLRPSFLPSSRESSRVLTQVESPAPHRGWHSRGYIPHWDHPGMIQSINFRLADAMPQSLLQEWRQNLKLTPGLMSQLKTCSEDERVRHTEFRRRIEKYLDASYGKCWLRRPAIAVLIQDAMLYFDMHRYLLLAWCVMPNHVHVLIETKQGFPLAQVLHSWKSFTSRSANKILGLHGEFWQREYLDRYVRNAEHYTRIIAYIEANPVMAGLVHVNNAWPWSSARFRPGGAGILPA